MAAGEGLESSVVTRMGLGAPGVKRVVGRAQSLSLSLDGDCVPGREDRALVWTLQHGPGPGAGLVTRRGQHLGVACAGGRCDPGGRGMTPGAGVGSGALTGVQGPVAGNGQELAGEGDTGPHPGLGQIPASGGQGSLEWRGLAARRGRGCGSTLSSDGVGLTRSGAVLLPLKMGGSSSGWI